MCALFDRQWIPSDQQPDKDSVTVMSYNILNDFYTKGLFATVEQQLLLTSRRYPLIAKEVIAYNCDIVCIQEIGTDAFGILTKSLSSHGYIGTHAEKKLEDGLATFYKSSRFDLVTFAVVPLTFEEMKRQNILKDLVSDDLAGQISERVGCHHNALFVKLKDRETNTTVNVANLHTVWGFASRFDVQCLQVSVALGALWTFSNNGAEPYVICGDFNSSPTMPTYRWLKEGYLTPKLIEDIQRTCTDGGKNVDIAETLKNSLAHKYKLQSCYVEIMGDEPPLTSCEVDSDGQYEDYCLDFIFLNTEQCRVDSVLQTPSKSRVDKTSGLPNEIFPSDHFSIAASVAFKMFSPDSLNSVIGNP